MLAVQLVDGMPGAGGTVPQLNSMYGLYIPTDGTDQFGSL
jgi:hypothetical protein